jgi:hypothetical protein
MMPLSFAGSQDKKDDERSFQKGLEDNFWHGVFLSIIEDRIPRRIVTQRRARRNAQRTVMGDAEVTNMEAQSEIKRGTGCF